MFSPTLQFYDPTVVCIVVNSIERFFFAPSASCPQFDISLELIIKKRTSFQRAANHVQSRCSETRACTGLVGEDKGFCPYIIVGGKEIRTFSRLQQFNTITCLPESPRSIWQLSRSNYSLERYKYRILSLFGIS